MKVIQEANKKIVERYGKFFGDINPVMPVKLHRFMMILPGKGENTLMYNGLTKELLEFEPGDDFFDEHLLKNLWFVPDEKDEVAIALKIKDDMAGSRPGAWHPWGYTIVTTTDCNARCFYCYEKGVARKNMTDKTAGDVGDYIVKNYIDPEKKKTISLSWFGGEPLFNKKAIEIITSKLSEAGVPFKSSMVTNGYLFDSETVYNAKKNWHLRNCQITIDGTGEVYRKAKNYINGDVDPLTKVLDNINFLSLNGISVSIRINVGYYNCEDVKSLVETLAERFGRRRNVSIYVHALFEKEGQTDALEVEKRRTVYSELEKIEDRISEMGLDKGQAFSNEFNVVHCMADSGKHAVIQCNGDISLCEHFVDSEKFGSIYGEEKDMTMFEKFREIAEPVERCFYCPLFAECSILKMCEKNFTECDESSQTYKLKKKARKILKAAENFYNKKKSETEDEERKTDGTEQA